MSRLSPFINRLIGHFLVLVVILSAATPAFGDGNDLMFPPPASVGKIIRVDGKGFILHGQRTFIASGSLHYARVPRALWADRLERMKRAGFNTVSTYIFWAYQEPKQGEISFYGRRNLSAFLALVKKMHMYAILRIGPYNNGEWSNGGLPNWLRFIPNMSVRTFTPPFINALTPYFDKLLPMVAANQITHGGPVVMVQMENEYGPGWGAVLNNRYLRWMHTMALKNGINVPFFFSGLHQGFNPAGVHSFNSVGRPTPWFSTELWSGWFNAYGDANPDIYFHWQFIHNAAPPVKTRSGGNVNAIFEKLHLEAVWRVLAFGGSGYNIFMAVGGSNFSHWNCRSVRASYDFGSPIGQAGDLRVMYYHYKQANYFARSFAPVLENSTNATAPYRAWLGTPRTGIHVYARKSPAGTIVFIMNTGNAPYLCSPPGGTPVTILPGHTFPVELHFQTLPWLHLTEICARVLAIRTTAGAQTLLVYGPAHSRGIVRLHLAAGNVILHKSPEFSSIAKVGNAGIAMALPIRFPGRHPRVYSLVTKKGVFRILTESRGMAAGTWFLHKPTPSIVIGPWYVGKMQNHGMRERMLTECPLRLPTAWAYVYRHGNWTQFVPPKNQSLPVKQINPAPQLGPWQVRLADGPAQPGYNDSHWLTSARPRQLGFGDYPGDYQWYRAKLIIPTSGMYHLLVPRVSNYAAFFLNGRKIAFGNPSVIQLQLRAGTSELAILAIAQDRSKICSYVGPFRYIDYKGFFRPLRLVLVKPAHPSVVKSAVPVAKGNAPVVGIASKSIAVRAIPPLPDQGIITDWRIHGGIGSPMAPAGWQPVSAASPPPGVPCFYRTTFSWLPNPGGQHTILRVSPGTLFAGFMWINGHNLGRYPDFNMPMGLYLPSCWLKPGINSLVVLDDAGNSVSGCKLVVEAAASRRIITLHPQHNGLTASFKVPPSRHVVMVNTRSPSFGAPHKAVGIRRQDGENIKRSAD